MIRWGVSPAWMISRYGGSFGPVEIEREIPRIEKAGFQSLQLEIFDTESIGIWESGKSRALQNALAGSSLSAEVFVAHCLLHGLVSSGTGADRSWEEIAERIASVAAQIPTIETVVIPLPPFADGSEDADARDVFLKQWHRIQEPFTRRGLRLAIEVLPGSAGGTPKRLAWLMKRPEFAQVGLNLDTGHFHAAGFDIPELIRSHRIYATHICDNDGIKNDSAAPGKGTIQWAEVFRALDASRYRGAWDLEIICEPEQVDKVYRDALNSCIALTREMRSMNMEGV